MKESKILFVTYGGGHSEIIKRIIDSLKIDNYLVLALTSAYKSFSGYNRCGIEDVYHNLSDLDKRCVDKIIDYILNHDLSFGIQNDRSTLLYYSIGALDFVKSNDISRLSDFHWDRHSFCQISAVNSFLDNHRNVKLIVTTTSPRFERAFLLVARNIGIPTIQIDDLFANDEAQFLGDKIVVCSSLEKERLIRKGVQEEKIYDLGNLIFEENYIMNVNPKKNRFIFFCPHKDKLYDSFGNVVFEGNDHENHISEFRSLSKLLSNNTGYSLMVRPHPNDDPREYIQYKDICDFEIVTTNEQSLIEAIKISALWITPASTTAVQSSLAGVPTITYTFRNNDKHLVTRMTQPPFLFFQDLLSLDKGLSDFSIDKPLKNKVVDLDWSFLKKSKKRIVEFILNEFLMSKNEIFNS